MPGTDTDLAILIDAAFAAGTIAKGYFGDNPQVWDKAGGAGPVTEADLAVNVMLKDRLCAARPGYGWLSEESTDTSHRLSLSSQFVVDPIDGTRAFIAGTHDWAHALAVVTGGQVMAAAVYLPMRDQMFAASLGGGATLNGEPIAVSATADLADATVLASKANFKPHYWRDDQPPPIKQHFRSSLAYRMCLVAQGRFDAMITLRPTWEWDVAAGTLIVTEAGGTVRTRCDQHPVFNNENPLLDGLVAGGPVRMLLQDKLQTRTVIA